MSRAKDEGNIVNKKGPIRCLINYVPESVKRLYRYLLNPKIPKGQPSETELKYVYVDFVTSLVTVSGLVAALKYILPDYFEINPISLINWYILGFVLIINAFLFSLILYALLIIPLAIRDRRNHIEIFYQSIKAFAIENILIAVMVAVAINRIIVKGNFHYATSSLDLWIGSSAAGLGLLLIWWLIIRPLVMYIKQYYKKTITYFLAWSAVIVVVIIINFVINIKLEYFNNLIDSKEFCSQDVSYKYKNELVDSKYNRDYLVEKCLEKWDKHNKQ